MEIVSAWTQGARSFFASKVDGGVKVRAVPARFSFFVTNLDDEDRMDLGRDKRVKAIKVEQNITRIDCTNRWARKDLIELLERVIYARKMADTVQILEGDVNSVMRIMADTPTLQVDPNPRFAYLDIETDSRKSFEDAREGYARILSWAICGDDQIIQSAVLDEDENTNERKLISKMFEALKPFDVVLAWNGEGFDFPVIQNRMEKLNLEIESRRWCWLDHMAVYKKYNMHSDGGGEEKSSFKLDHVAMYLLGEGKQEFDASKTWEAWAAGGSERERMLRYNEKDTQLLPRIEERTGFLSLHMAVCHICRIFADTNSLNATRQGDGFLLRLGDEYGHRWPTRKEVEENQTKFKGAYVMTPTRTGAIENVHVADFAGLYPSIIRTWNMSPDTKLDRDDWEEIERLGLTPGKGEISYCTLPNRPTGFHTAHDGMFRIALDRLVAKRAEYTQAMKEQTPGSEKHTMFKRLSGAFKIVANSFYGIMGSPWSRFFDPEIAEGVTQTGRWLLENVIDASRERGLDPFYGDTDSVFVSGDADDFRDVVKYLNADWSNRLDPYGVGDHHIDLDFEKTFKRVIFLAKKRYAGKFSMYKGKATPDDAKPEVKGLEFKRGDTIRLARNFQMEVINLLLGEHLPTALEVREVVERWKQYTLEGDLKIEDVVVSKSLSKHPQQYEHPPAHARVALLMVERGDTVLIGQRIPYVVTGMLDGKAEVIPASDEGAVDLISREYYWSKNVFPPVQRVLEAVYPQDTWNDPIKVARIAGGAERKRKATYEANGQHRLFDDGSTSTANARRLKMTDSKPFVIRVNEPPVEAIDAESVAGRRNYEALRAILEANPGPRPVVLKIRSKLDDRGFEVEIPTGLTFTPTKKAILMIKRVFG